MYCSVCFLQDDICENQSEIETFDELDKNSLITWEKYLDITSTVACRIGTTVEDEMFEILRRSPLPILSNDAVDDFSDIILSQGSSSEMLIIFKSSQILYDQLEMT